MAYNKNLYTSSTSALDAGIIYDQTETKMQSEVNASIKSEVNNVKNTLNSAESNIEHQGRGLAIYTNSTTAPKSILKGKYICWNGKYYEANKNIAGGADLTTNDLDLLEFNSASGPEGILNILKAIVSPIGTVVTGTKVGPAPTCANSGGSAIIASITLTKGHWILVTCGYSPVMISNKVTSQNTAISYVKDSGTIEQLSYGTDALSYGFEMIRVINVTSNSAVINLRVTNWESAEVTCGTNYDFYAVRLI